MSKSARKIIGTVAPIAASFIPGVGPVLGAAIGAGGGLLSGGGAKGALLGGLTGGLGAGGGSILGKAAGLGTAATKGLTGALMGGLSGAGTGGGLKSALLGAGLGGLGGYALGGGVPAFGAPSGAALDTVSGIAGMQGPTRGSGLVGALTRGASGLGNALGLSGGGSSSGGGLSLGNLGTVYSGINQAQTMDDLEERLLAAQGKAQNQLAPFQKTGVAANQLLSSELGSGDLGGQFNPSDLTQTPGYQFRLQEGNKALERSLAARGMSESGAAMKAAQEYGQGLAEQTYNDAYNQWLQQQQQRYNMLSGQSAQGLTAATGSADIFGDMGNAQGASLVGKSNAINQMIAGLTGNNKRLIGFDLNNNPIYG